MWSIEIETLQEWTLLDCEHGLLVILNALSKLKFKSVRQNYVFTRVYEFSQSSPGPFQIHSKSFLSIPIQNERIWTRG